MTGISTGDRLVVVAVSELAEDSPEAGIDIERWRALAHGALLTERGGEGELNLIFIDETEMAELNATHMDGDGPTDVLAFPIDGEDDVAGLAPAGPGALPTLLGDVVVCPTVARRYAAEHGVSFEDEIALLVVHGVLHILGHDHGEPDEAHAMRACEVALLAEHHQL